MKIILAILPLLFSLAVSLAQSKEQSRTISVSGEAEIKVVPDEAIVRFGVETQNKSLDAARSENDKRVSDVIAAAKSLGIDAKLIQTDYLSVYPSNDWEDYERKKKSELYVMNKSITITVKDLKKLEELVTTTLKLGVNRVQDIQFRTSELRKFRDQARVMAVRAAKEKAELMAKELGQTVGRPDTISEEDYSYYTPYYRGRADMRTQNVMSSDGSGLDVDGSIAVGQIAVKAKVHIVFQLQDK